MTTRPSEGRRVWVDGLQIEIDALDSLGLGQGLDFEPEIKAAVQRLVREGDTAVDIGANIGYFSALLARAVGPAGVVHAIEPEPGNHALLAHNMHLNGFRHVRLHALALGAQEGVAELHTSVSNNGMHRLYNSVCCSGPAVQVPVQRLDDLLADLPAVDFIKIDIEGYELQALQGAQALLRRSQNVKVVSEYCPSAMLEAGAEPSALWASLGGLGLVAHDLAGVPVDMEQVLDDARRCEAFGRKRFVAACAGQDNDQIMATVFELTRQLGCRRPVIENLLFMRFGSDRLVLRS